MDKNELRVILDKHILWVRDEKGGVRANLRRADLRGADLREADLQGADLRDADLQGAYLRGADLRGASLRRADLQGTNLFKTDLRGADLWGAGLFGANLCGADLRGADLLAADLREADLQAADLQWADLQDADLRRANLRRAYLRDANLQGAYLRGCENLLMPFACPDEGSFVGFKKAKTIDGISVIVKLEIAEDAKRCSATSRKCRCDKAKVLSITNLDGSSIDCDYAISSHDSDFKYILGSTVEVGDFDPNRWNECSTGIHFFITRDEAVNY